jgi:hypothetical protein
MTLFVARPMNQAYLMSADQGVHKNHSWILITLRLGGVEIRERGFHQTGGYVQLWANCMLEDL